MASRVRTCEQFSLGENEYKVQDIMCSITPTSTVEEFQEKCRENRGFQLAEGGRLGWHILGHAASKGNFKVVDYILQSMGKATLNMGNRQGVTPLFSACHFARDIPATPQQIYRTVEVLFQHKADPNLATTTFLSGRATPLWTATKARDVALVRLLLSHGAELGDCPLSSEDEELLEQARAYRRDLHGALDDRLLPPLGDIVVDYSGAPPYEI